VITPPPARRAEAEAIAREAGALANAPARVLVAPASAALHDLVAVLRRAAVVFTVDTANVHIASAVGTPQVALYTAASTDLRVWAPLGVPYHVVYLEKGRLLTTLTGAELADAFDALWSELHPVPARAATPAAAPAGATADATA
jgi:ADP-heptose:LPS heptosyltransferase